MARYRIVNDCFLGYEVQVKYKWWPFWIEAGFTNTHPSVEKAEEYARNHAKRAVKELGEL